MRQLQHWQKTMNDMSKAWEPRSLRFRLALGMAIVAAVGLGGVAVWLGWTMQRILISAHKDNILYIAERMPHNIEIYQQMYSQREALQKAVANVSRDNVFLWIENQQGTVIARTGGLETPQPLPMSPEIANFPFPGIKVSQLDGRYWILCANPLLVNNQRIGELYIAQDISADQMMFLQVMRNLGVATVIAIGGMTVVSSIYIARSLRPLQQICQLTESISAEHLGNTSVQLKQAPTEVKQLAERFDEMLMRLHRSWEQQRQFVSNVSHELRTPLTIVSGYLQSVQRRGNNLNEVQREALAMASLETDRTVQLLEDLLTLARVDNGQMQFQLETVCLNEFVQQAIALVRQYSERPIHYQALSHPIAVKVDRNRLKQVLLNLIDNAIKYSEPEQPITLSVKQKDAIGILSVRDRGIGIPLAQQTRIFERFYRVDEARSRSVSEGESPSRGGTGLGLSIVKTLVEGMGGEIDVSSRFGEGTTFTVSFPVVS